MKLLSLLETVLLMETMKIWKTDSNISESQTVSFLHICTPNHQKHAAETKHLLATWNDSMFISFVTY